MSSKLPLFEFTNQRFSVDGNWYCGIDFANDINELGICLIEDDLINETLTAHSIVARPPVTNRTLQLIRDLLLVEGVLEANPRGQKCLPDGCNVRKATEKQLLSALQLPTIQQRLLAIPAATLAVPLNALLQKVGYASDAISQAVLSPWDFLFEAVPKFSKDTYSQHDELSRIDYITWLAERTLTASGKIRMSAIDSPLGTCMDFATVLRGEIPTQLIDNKLKERATERFWRNRLIEIAKNYPETIRFFDQSSHLKSSAGLEIVPEAIYCLLKTLGNDGLMKARLGSTDAKVIEAAPRVFLYSMIERIRQFELNHGRAIDQGLIRAVKQYKSKEDSERGLILDFLLEHFTSWSGGVNRQFQFAVDKQKLVADNHLFDAWLTAMTAWSFCHKQTLSSEDAGLDSHRTEAEGHIIALQH